VVAASRDAALAREVQDLFASPSMRVNLTTDVIGECGGVGCWTSYGPGAVYGQEQVHMALSRGQGDVKMMHLLAVGWP
jgi:glycerol-3-phosphate dehydrogenase (NAD+)